MILAYRRDRFEHKEEIFPRLHTTQSGYLVVGILEFPLGFACVIGVTVVTIKEMCSIHTRRLEKKFTKKV